MVGGMGHVKKSGQLSFRDINESCILIITADRKKTKKKKKKKTVAQLYSRGGVIQ